MSNPEYKQPEVTICPPAYAEGYLDLNSRLFFCDSMEELITEIKRG